MATIIGRKQEQKELRRLYESDEAEMVVVYGRRRVGKTYLVNQTFKEYPTTSNNLSLDARWPIT